MNPEVTEWLFTALLTYFAHSSLFLLAAWLLTARGLVRRIALQELLWRTALLAGLVSTPIHMAGLVDPVTRPMPLPAMPVAVSEPAASPMSASPVQPASQEPAVSRGIPAPSMAAALSGPEVLLAAWAAISALLLAKLMLATVRLRYQLRGRQRLDAPQTDGLCRRLAARLDMQPPRISVQAGLASPFCLPRGEIVLPEWALDLSAGQLKAMLAHELAHLKRRDPAWLIAGRMIQAVASIQPLNRVANQRLRDLSEFACDAWSRRVCESGRALAECLAECARRQLGRDSSRLVAAMASHRSPVVERVRRLLQGSPECERVSAGSRALVWTASMMIALLAPSFAAGERMPTSGGPLALSSSSSGSIAINHRGLITVQMEYEHEDRTVTVQGKGRFGFNEDESDMVSISDGGYLDLREDGADATRRVRFEEQSGAVHREFWRDGQAVSADRDMRDWLARAIPDFYRMTGIDAEARAGRIFERAGVDGVLEEMQRIPGSFALRSYATALAKLDQLSDSQSRRWMDLAAAQMGSYDLREALTAYVRNQDPSDSEWRAFAETAGQIASSFDRRETLSAASKQGPGSAGNWHALLDAASGISSSFDLRETLVAFSDGLPTDDRTMALLAETAAGGIKSNFDLRETISAYARRDGYGAGGWMALLDATERIGGSFDRRETLVKIAANMPRDPALVSRYRDVASGISSNYDRREAERAL